MNYWVLPLITRRLSRRHVASTASCVSFVVAAVACSSNPAAPASALPLTIADVAGTYALVSVNGQRLPAPFGQGSTVIFDTLTLARDGTWTVWEGGGLLGSAAVTDSGRYRGTWTLDIPGRQILRTSTDRYGNSTVLPFVVGGHGDTLTFDAGPVDPARPGGGLWISPRVR